MSLRRTLAGAFLGRVLAAPPDYDEFWYRNAPGRVNTQAGVAINSDNAIEVSSVAACDRIISGTCAKVPLPIYRKESPDSEDRARWRKHPLWDVLNYKANGWQTSYDFRRTMTSDVCRRGNGYALKVPGPRGTVDKLFRLHPDCVTPELRDEDTLVYHVLGRNGIRVTYDQDRIFHLRDHFTRDGISGVSRIDQARQGIGVARAAEIQLASLFGNGCEPAVALTTDKVLDDNARKRILASLKEAHRGPFNAGGVFIGENGLKLEKLPMSNRDAQAIEVRIFQVEDIGRFYGVHPHFLGQADKQSSWGTGVEQVAIQLLAYTILDWFEMWETSIARDLIDYPDFYFAEHNADGMLRADYKTRMEGHEISIRAGINNPDEVRRKENQPPRKDGYGDRYLMPSNSRYADEPMQPADAGNGSNGTGVPVPKNGKTTDTGAHA